MKQILLIVDPQNDFITGSLAVEEAEEKMMKLAEYIKNKGCEYDYIYITLDSHPEDHISFKENGGIWPKHCVIETDGWGMPEYLGTALLYTPAPISSFRKGTKTDSEEYSIFDNDRYGSMLYDHIKKLSRQEDVYIDVCGIAGDYCVLETVKGLRKFMDDKYINVLTEYTASIDGGKKLKEYISF